MKKRKISYATLRPLRRIHHRKKRREFSALFSEENRRVLINSLNLFLVDIYLLIIRKLVYILCQKNFKCAFERQVLSFNIVLKWQRKRKNFTFFWEMNRSVMGTRWMIKKKKKRQEIKLDAKIKNINKFFIFLKVFFLTTIYFAICNMIFSRTLPIAICNMFFFFNLTIF